jgi:general secretion pathway protein L
MTEYLVIRLGETANETVSWMAVDSDGTTLAEPRFGTLGDAAEALDTRSVIVLVPATEVLTVSVDIPARGARLQAALPYALEDQLAQDIDNLHFAAGKRLDSGQVPVAVATHERMEDWLSRLDEAGIEANRMIPENHGLPLTPNTMSILIAERGLMFNDGAGVQFMLDGIGPADAVAAGGGDDDELGDGGHLLVYGEEDLRDQYETELAMLRTELSSVDVKTLPDGILPRLAVTVATGAGINLLQGQYGASTQVLTLLRPWRYAAMFLVALGVVGLLGKGADYYNLNKEVVALEAQFTAEYRQIKPGDTRPIADPLAVIRSLRQEYGGGGAEGPQIFLPSMRTLADALRANEAADVEAVSYRAGVATVRLSAPDIPTLDRIVQAIDASGRFTASLQSATNVGDRVQSRITIREVGA